MPTADRCPQCPVPADSPRPCLGESHRPACSYVAAGRPDWIAHLPRLASGEPPAPDPGRVDVRLAMLADLCEHGSGTCGCNPDGPPRDCSRPDRPAKVWRAAHCIPCKAREDWEAGVEAVG